ncbi:MAG: hypothetical protein MUC48_11800 [Leptolyngbya sp. Prado105]|nr:hypothetical protein [Leptolyngbya sp. Prado105]
MATKGEPVSKGFAVGLQIWLLFLISLYALGYPALFSIALGAVGGTASGFIVDWWLSKDENIEPTRRRVHDDGVENIARSRQRRRVNSALQQRKRRREQEPVTLKTLTRPFFQREQPNKTEEVD